MVVSAVLGVVLVLAAVAYAGLAGYVWRHREIPGSAGLIVCLLAVGFWSVCYGVELNSTDVDVARVWSALKFVGIVLLAPGLWAYVLRYTAHTRPLPPLLVGLLLVHPAVVLALLALPATHDLVHYYPVQNGRPLDQEYLGGMPVTEPGLLFWPLSIYLYVLLLGAVGLLVYRLLRLTRAYRRQAAVLIAAALLPFGGNVAFLLLLPDRYDPSPFLFGVLAVVAVWGLMRVRLVGALRVARTVVVDRLADAVLVLDLSGRIADLNPAAQALLGGTRERLVGTVLVRRLPEVATALERHAPATTTEGDLGLGDGRTLAVQVTSVEEAGQEAGRVVVLRDVSQRRSTQRRLVGLLQEQTRIAGTLQESLRPRTLPDIDGVELAARWVPSGVGGPLSGDFYDVHPAGGGRWAFVMGDVVGKGVHAAVVTALARYTVRALSAQGLAPVEVVRALNEALLSEDDERFCTVVYAQFEASPAGGLDVRLVLGGHPQPVLRRRGGAVSAVGRPGTVLGLMAVVEVYEEEVHLSPGDLLLAYTDGVTEARSRYESQDHAEFGEDHLAAVVSAAGEGAENVTDAVLKVLTALAEQRDDLALLAVGAEPPAG